MRPWVADAQGRIITAGRQRIRRWPAGLSTEGSPVSSTPSATRAQRCRPLCGQPGRSAMIPMRGRLHRPLPVRRPLMARPRRRGAQSRGEVPRLEARFTLKHFDLERVEKHTFLLQSIGKPYSRSPSSPSITSSPYPAYRCLCSDSPKPTRAADSSSATPRRPAGGCARTRTMTAGRCDRRATPRGSPSSCPA